MEDHIVRLEYEGKEIILVAAAHVLKESAEQIRQVIENERPDSVCVELDEGRYKNMQDPKAWEKTDVLQVIKTKKTGFLLANLLLGAYQKKIAGDLDSTAGMEMIEGIRGAKAVGAELVLADRDIRTTFLRVWRNMNLWEKAKLIFEMLFSFGEDSKITGADVKALLKEDVLETVAAEMRKDFPKIAEALLDERDQYLAFRIKNAPGKKIVAVLGGAHVPGVKEAIYKTQDMEKLSEVPPKSKAAGIITWVIPTAVAGLLLYSFIVSAETGWQRLLSWALWTGIPAALFTALAAGHPLSILTSLAAAPFTTLNPLIACGWITGIVEATLRKPLVRDINNVPRDIFSLKGFFKNRFLRVLLIVIMANIGSSLGALAAGLDLFRNIL